MLLEEILFPPFGQAYCIQKTFYFEYRAPYFRKIDVWDCHKDKNNSRKTYMEIFCF